MKVRVAEILQIIDDYNFVSGQHVSEVMNINGTKTEDHFMKGLERRRCTLALSALPGGWFIQVYFTHQL